MRKDNHGFENFTSDSREQAILDRWMSIIRQLVRSSLLDIPCDSKYKNIEGLKYHIDKHHPEHGVKKFHCDICTKGFLFRNAFTKHMASHNSDQKENVCEICGQKYVNTQTLKDHMLIRHPLPDATDFVCDICGYQNLSNKRLQAHILRKHNFGKHKPCPHCEFKSVTNKGIRVHIDRKHPEHGEKQFFCDVCGKGFIFKVSLTNHPIYYCPKNPKFKGRNKKGRIPSE